MNSEGKDLDRNFRVLIRQTRLRKAMENLSHRE